MKKWIGILLKTVLPLALGVYLVWYFFDRMSTADKESFYDAIYKANYGWIILSMALSFLALLSRAYRWKYMLEPLGYQTRFWNRYHALMIGYIVNLTIPRAGEASRSVMLYRSDGVPFSKSFGTILAERAIDLVMLLAVVLVTISIGHDDFWNIKYRMEQSFGGTGKEGESSLVASIVYGVLIAGLVAGMVVFMIKRFRDKLLQFIKDLFAGVFSILRSRHPLSYLGHTVFIWLMYVSYFAIAFLSLDEAKEVPFAGIMIAFVAGSLGISFTNGGIGSFPLLVGLVLDFYLNADGKHAAGIGSALGMIIWSSQTLMMILLGALSFVLLPKNYTEKDEPAH